MRKLYRFLLLTALIVGGIILWAEKNPPSSLSTSSNAPETGGPKTCGEADLECWTSLVRFEASPACAKRIERLARYDVEWTDGWLEPLLTRMKWRDDDHTVITFFGDKVKFQNGFGAWQPHVYRCDFNIFSRQVVDVSAAPGRIE